MNYIRNNYVSSICGDTHPIFGPLVASVDAVIEGVANLLNEWRKEQQNSMDIINNLQKENKELTAQLEQKG